MAVMIIMVVRSIITTLIVLILTKLMLILTITVLNIEEMDTVVPHIIIVILRVIRGKIVGR